MCGVHRLAGEPHCPRCWESRLYTNCCKGRERDEVEARVIGGVWILIFVCLIGKERSWFTGQGVTKQCSTVLVLEEVGKGRMDPRKET